MTTEKLVNKALFGKTELASQKIELASAKDLENILTKIYSEQTKTDKIKAIYEKSVKDLENSKFNLQNQVNTSENLLSEFLKQANDLGISADSVPSYKKLVIEVQNTKSEYLK